MMPFDYTTVATPADAIALAGPGTAFISGGTDLLQLMQEGVVAPEHLVDISALDLDSVASDLDGFRIGALARLADVADHPTIRQRLPVIAEALDATASGQVRNMATIGGNLLQRTRCLYFRDAASPCNKRVPGSGCPARDGRNRINAVLGGSEHCIAAHASDLAVALVACDAEVIILGPHGERSSHLAEFYRVPGSTPDLETTLHDGELITAVWVPLVAAGRRSRYLKVRDRGSFEWALASCAASIGSDGNRVIEARLVAGGVGTVPWRLHASERALVDRPLDAASIGAAAERAAEGAEPLAGNAFKVPMLQGTVRRILTSLADAA